MILSLGLGETSYIPDAHLGRASDEVDIMLSPVLQLCSGREICWDVLARIGASREWCSLGQLSTDLGVGGCHIAEQLRPARELGFVEEQVTPLGPRYRLAAGVGLQRLTSYLAPPALQ